jgi:pyruvate/2-oxoglutarate/acetoin dehydrogenase E1 component
MKHDDKETTDENAKVVEIVNRALIRRLSKNGGVVFGQNITAGSRISGLGKGLDEQEGIIALNTPNSENSLMGFGLGLMLSGTDSAYVMKQHDFALLGLDHLTNTVNSSKLSRPTAAFIVLMVVVDSGFEGPQASLNNLDEFASLSRSPVHYLNTRGNMEAAFQSTQSGGLHLMAVSQKMLRNTFEDLPGDTNQSAIGALSVVSPVSEVLIVFFGLDLGYFREILAEFQNSGLQADYLIATSVSPSMGLGKERISKYKSIVVISTSKSEISYAQKWALSLSQISIPVRYFGRESSDRWSQVNEDRPELSPSDIFRKWIEFENGI